MEYLTYAERKQIADDSALFGLHPSQDTLNSIFTSMRLDLDQTRITVNGYLQSTLSPATVTCRPVTRWSREYSKRTLAKFYKLEPYINGRVCTMMTLTMSSKDIDRVDHLQTLENGRRKLVNLIKKDRDADYIYVYEPHKSGYAHCHILMFCQFSPAEKEKYKRLWNEKYGIGGYKNALHFSRSVKLENGKNYLMKYVSKTLMNDIGQKIGGLERFAAVVSFCSRHDTEQRGIRLYGMSRNFSASCKRESAESDFIPLDFEMTVCGEVIKKGKCKENAKLGMLLSKLEKELNDR